MLGLNLQALAWKIGGAALVAIAIYLIGHSAGVRAEQKRADKTLGGICAAAGSTWVEVDGKGKPLPRSRWGKSCLQAASDLAAFKADALAQRTALIEHFNADQDQKTATAKAAASKQAAALATAKKNMETENAAVKDDRVGGSWFARLNELGGLRPSGAQAADGAVRGAEGAPPY